MSNNNNSNSNRPIIAMPKKFNEVKIEHFKTKASVFLKDGNYVAAYETYTNCIEMVLSASSSPLTADNERRRSSTTAFSNNNNNNNNEEKILLEKLYCNRSLTYEKAGKYELALKDAEKCAETNSKAWWRKAMAYKGLSRFPNALECFRKSFTLLTEQEQPSFFPEYHKLIKHCTRRLTREELGRFVLNDVNALCLPPRLEAVTKLEQEEAIFRAIKEEHDANKPPGDYYTYVTKWVLKPMSLSMAYIQRSLMFYKANCFKQARLDAAMAIENCKGGVSNGRKKNNNKTTSPPPPPPQQHEIDKEEEEEYIMTYKEPSIHTKYSERTLKIEPFAWYLLGKGFQGEPGFSREAFVPDNNAAGKCFARAQHLDPENEMYKNAFRSMTANLSNIEMSAVLDDKNEQYETSEFGIVDYDSNTESDVYLGHGIVKFECVNVKLAMFTTELRFQLREFIANEAKVDLKKVLIEGVKLVVEEEEENTTTAEVSDLTQTQGTTNTKNTPAAAKQALNIEIQIDFAEDNGSAKSYMNSIHLSKVVLKTLGLGKFAFVGIELVTAKTLSFKGTGFGKILEEEISAGKEIVVAQRPSRAIDLPYQNYKLTNADGTSIERANKHGFAMTEIHYEKGHMGRNKENVWVSMMDDSIRWRQSSSEVKIIVNTVPKDRFSKHHLEVTIRTKSLKIVDRDTKEVYLQGDLEYHILPESSSWYHLQGDGEDAFVFLLEKANLKLLSSAEGCEHSDMWWVRLFLYLSLFSLLLLCLCIFIFLRKNFSSRT
jgi:tetratricopeptide (TPR) repeat protein